MASVILDFVPPEYAGFTELRIFEMADPGGPPVLIETVEVDPNNYITRYTTNDATAPNFYFAIQWRDPEGGYTDLSTPVQGGTYTVVGRIVQRVLLRDPTLNENVVFQLAEWAVSMVFATEDVYGVDPSEVTLNQYEGMTLLVMGRTYATYIHSASAGESYTAGLVSQKSTASLKDIREAIDYLLAEANNLLGTAITFIMLLDDIDPLGGLSISGVETDQSRLLTTMYEID